MSTVQVSSIDNVDDPPVPVVEAPVIDDPAALRAALEDGRATLRHIIDHGLSGPEVDAAVQGVVAAVAALHALTCPHHEEYTAKMREFRIAMAQRTAERAQAELDAAKAELDREGEG